MTRMGTDPGESAFSLRSYQFELPDSLIAQEPAQNRSDSRCIFTLRGEKQRQLGNFPEIVDHLRGDELLVYNDTRVIPARIRAQRATGGKVEIFLLRPCQDGESWLAWISPSRRIKPGETLEGPDVAIRVHGREGSSWRVEWPAEVPLERIGEVPLPPYIQRKTQQTNTHSPDKENKKTRKAKTPSPGDAPTAGLHFDQPILEALAARGVQRAGVTLHVGPGTFKPIESEQLTDHRVDPEWYSISSETRTALHKARKEKRPIIAIGTTSMRVLESLPDLTPGDEIIGETDLTILPGYQFRHADGLLTNFHLPGSSLLVLVSCFHGLENTLNLYREAVENQFRFYSYGDCMLITPQRS